MGYNIKDVFYLSTETTIAGSQGLGGSAQLDLSAYIDPIARGRQKGTGLAIYKVHWQIMKNGDDSEPLDDQETGVFSYGLVAGAGYGDVATGGLTIGDDEYAFTNSLLISSGQFYGPKSMEGLTTAPTAMFNSGLMPSTEVPYVVVRDNVCMTYSVAENFASSCSLSCRLEVAQISLDQSTLNQLLRTQTV